MKDPSQEHLPIMSGPAVDDPVEKIIDQLNFFDVRDLSDDDRRRLVREAIGAWSDIDGNELLDAIERGRQERKPTPPLTDL
jgi:hypothetical protein